LHDLYHALTAREREVMTLVVSGMLNKHIATRIGASEATAKIHRGHVMEKMQAGSLIDLVRMADKLNSSVLNSACSHLRYQARFIRLPFTFIRLPSKWQFVRLRPNCIHGT
jgi:DNA-binding CsgD family transcriptional regulator